MKGFVTGCFDGGLHVGHSMLLMQAACVCDELHVGLTTDDQIEKEKGKSPICSFSERKCHIEDMVKSMWGLYNSTHKSLTIVENRGESKLWWYENMYQFDTLFTSDEYVDNESIRQFVQAKPNIHIVYVPRYTRWSVTEHHQRLLSQHIDVMQTHRSLNGTMVHLSEHKSGSHKDVHDVYFKPIHISQLKEMHTRNMRDNVIFGQNHKIPRNWKFVCTSLYPNIPGLNPYREVCGNILCQHQTWSVFVRHTPTHMVMRHGGTTLSTLDWITISVEVAVRIYKQVRIICNDLYSLCVVHGDIHLGNLTYCSERDMVFLLDFGWCTHDSFEMDSGETTYHKAWLDNDLDFAHFCLSMRTVLVPNLYEMCEKACGGTSITPETFLELIQQ